MNSPTLRTDAERNAYLRTVLQMNPLQHAEEILALRNRYRGIKPPTAHGVSDVETQKLRQQAVDGLEWIREKFWVERLTVLLTLLDELPLKPFPDLRQAAQRLKVLAAWREEFPRLLEATSLDPDLYSRLQRILVESPLVAGPLKEDIQEALSKGAQRKWILGWLSSVKREMPEVYNLERDWFDLLRRERASRWARRPLERFRLSMLSLLPKLIILGGLIAALLSAKLRNDKASVTPPSRTQDSPLPNSLLQQENDQNRRNAEGMNRIFERLEQRRKKSRQNLDPELRDDSLPTGPRQFPPTQP